MDEVRQKIIHSIETAPDEKALSAYLFHVAKKLNPKSFEAQTMTMKNAILRLLDEETIHFELSLADPKFKPLSDFFALTPGLHVIAAPSGHGKTFWALQWAEEAAKKNHPVLVVSLEMTPNDLGARSLSGISDVPLADLVRGKIDNLQRQLLKEIVHEEKYAYLENIHVDTLGDFDWIKINPRLWDRMLRLKPKLVIVDYAQLIFDSEERDHRTSVVMSEIARELKLFADQTESAVLLLSQMNREALKEVRKAKWVDIGHVPLTHEFVKESGGIVEAADSVQLVCVPQRFHACPPEFDNKFQIIVDKSRRLGELGTVLLPFDSHRMRFR